MPRKDSSTYYCDEENCENFVIADFDELPDGWGEYDDGTYKCKDCEEPNDNSNDDDESDDDELEDVPPGE